MNLPNKRRNWVNFPFLFIKHPIILFSANRYLSYGFQLLRGLIIAKFLGPYFFGIWGFITLTLQYLSYTSLGVEYAVTVELSTKSMDEAKEKDALTSVALVSMVLIGLIISAIGFILQLNHIELFSKYEFNKYVFLVGIITALTNVQQVLTNLYRVYRKLAKIAFAELLSSGLLFTTVLLFRNEQLIDVQLIGMVLAGILSLVLFLYHPPFKFSIELQPRVIRTLISIGIPLLIYNFSFYLIMVSARTIISIFYPVEIMGYYTLATSITTATLLGLRSVAWVVYPEILAKTHSGIDLELTKSALNRINDLYSTSVFLVIFIIILILPIIFIILPQYTTALPTITILLLSQAILSISFGYNSVAIARKKHNQVAKISMVSVIIITVTGFIVSLLHLNYVWIAIAVFIGSLFYTSRQILLGIQLFNVERINLLEFQRVLPLSSIFAAFCFLIGSIAGSTFPLWGSFGLGIFLLSNRNRLKTIWLFALSKVR